MNKIVLWYDNLHENNCSYADAVYTTRTICNKLKNNNIEFSIKGPTDAVDTSDINVYVIELLNVYINYDIFSLISEQSKERLRQGVSLLLYYPREGHTFDNWLFLIYENLKRNNLLKSKIFFVYGDNDFEEHYLEYIKDKNIENFLTPISFDFFKGDYYERAMQFNDSLGIDRNFDYLFYNGKLRPHRLFAVAELKHRQILSKGLVSLTATKHTGESYTINDCLVFLEKYNCCYPHIRKFAEIFTPMILDETPDKFSQNTVYSNTLDHYSESFFSIISETGLLHRFITEKIYKPIANLHPFILIGPPNVLQLLRSKGYKTFPELFDEDYDTELDPVKRIHLVLDEVEKFVNLSYEEKQQRFISIKDKLLYNKSLYFKNAQETKSKDFIDMFEMIGNANES